MRRNAPSLAAAVLAAVSIGACHRGAPRTPEAAAEQFIDEFFVRLAPEQALPLTDGTARARVEEIVKLRDEDGRTGAQASQVHPAIFWKRGSVERKPDGSTQLQYTLDIDSGGTRLGSVVTLVVKQVDGQFKVTNFVERDAGPQKK